MFATETTVTRTRLGEYGSDMSLIFFCDGAREGAKCGLLAPGACVLFAIEMPLHTNQQPSADVPPLAARVPCVGVWCEKKIRVRSTRLMCGGAWLRGFNARLRAKGTEVRVSLEILNSGQILV